MSQLHLVVALTPGTSSCTFLRIGFSPGKAEVTSASVLTGTRVGKVVDTVQMEGLALRPSTSTGLLAACPAGGTF